MFSPWHTHSAIRRSETYRMSQKDHPSLYFLEEVFTSGGRSSTAKLNCLFWFDIFRNTTLQAGALKALQEMYTLDEMDMTGASAGALCAVLAGCNVDMDRAFEVASRFICTNR